MNLTDITQQIKTYIQNDLKYTHDGLSNVFEVTIRILGGFLSAYHLTSDPFYLQKAQELGSILLLAFQNAPAGIPASSINFSKMEAVPEYLASTSEATTLQLEFKYLSYLTKNATYWNAAQNVFKVLLKQDRPDGLVPIYIQHSSGFFTGNLIRLGSRGDSYYEYLAKMWLQTNQTESTFHTEWMNSVKGIRKHLLGISTPHSLLFVGERPDGLQGSFSPKMDHLVCFLPGALALAATKGKRIKKGIKLRAKERMDLDLAEELTKGLIFFSLYALKR
jgi:mannosyl-oligosaccharide alpha-1,2-mannosidase